MAALESIPSEILSTIAYHLALSPVLAATPGQPPSAETRISALAGTLDSSTPTPSASKPIPTVFPAPLVPLLTTSKHIAGLLAFDANPQLYARIFAEKFDTAAIRRRTRAADLLRKDDGGGVQDAGGTSEGEEDVVVAGSVTDSALAAELRTRCMMMKRLRMAMRSGQASWVRPEDLFVVYLMLLENEGMEKEEMDDIEEFLFCLRPYVFAAAQFEVTYAPWTLIDLPLPRTTTPYVRPPHPLNHYMTDPTPRSRLVHVPHYGTMKPLCPPVLAHAAILNFFARVDKLFGVADAGGAGDGDGNDAGRDLTGGMDGPQVGPEAQGGVAAEVEVGEGTALGEGAGHMAGFRPRPSSRYIAYTPAKRSEIFDTDYKRLERCYDPTESPGLGIEDWVGRFTGCWEGSFSFFDYDAYKSMLSGESRALYEGQFGEQTQVWRLNEVYVRSKYSVPGGGGGNRRSRAAQLPIATEPEPEREAEARTEWFSDRVPMAHEERSTSASPLNAGFAPNSSTFDKLVPLLAAKRSGPLSRLTPQAISATHASGAMSTSATTATASTSTESITSAVVRMLESDDQATRDDYLVAMLGGLEGQKVVHVAEVEEIIRRRRGQVDTDDEDEDGAHSSEMEGMRGAAKGKQTMRGSVARPGDDLELMLVGTGHSAWGEFLLRGRVRLWDGMVTLVKEYSPDGRGRWLYRGYIVGNNVFVGRWRDCVTPQDFVGYEGTFSLAQRIDEVMDEGSIMDGIM
ncbi:hypothetical protein QFC21_006289 [Naganishia friedmannii]|uniref:Uncharacterized protein n=1 Tax=Naganishia friedmannii TaxID=89922 RepID=A0ACC2V3L0_9TREE|nr:hypothetical protein QFC21_006289 [Naganishia friedmannii]